MNCMDENVQTVIDYYQKFSEDIRMEENPLEYLRCKQWLDYYNISDLITNYIDCPVIETVVFSYGFHGRRREVFEKVMQTVAKKDFKFIPFLLTCSEEENIKRMNMDNRSLERKQRAIEESRKAFGDLTYPQIDITDFSASEAAENIIKEAGLSLSKGGKYNANGIYGIFSR